MAMTNKTPLDAVQRSFVNRTASRLVREQSNDPKRSASIGKPVAECTFGDAVALLKPLGMTRAAVVALVEGATKEGLAELKAANKAAIRKPAKQAKAKAAKKAKSAEPTVADLVAQLAELQAQLAALQG
jgi:hypothetical protein